MRVEFLPAAEAELRQAVGYYNEQCEGLGFEFAVEARRTIERIVAYPAAWPVLSKHTRRCRMMRFPYGVVYEVRADMILVLAVMHLHRRPGCWQSQ